MLICLLCCWWHGEGKINVCCLVADLLCFDATVRTSRTQNVNEKLLHSVRFGGWRVCVSAGTGAPDRDEWYYQHRRIMERAAAVWDRQRKSTQNIAVRERVSGRHNSDRPKVGESIRVSALSSHIVKCPSARNSARICSELSMGILLMCILGIWSSRVFCVIYIVCICVWMIRYDRCRDVSGSIRCNPIYFRYKLHTIFESCHQISHILCWCVCVCANTQYACNALRWKTAMLERNACSQQ